MTIRDLLGDIHVNELARGFSFAFLLRISGMAVGFLLSIWIARVVGTEGAGLVALATTCLAICSLIGRLGLDNGLLRFVAEAVAMNDMSRAAGAARKGLLFATTASLVASLLLYGIADWLAIVVFSDPSLAPLLEIISLAVLPMTLCLMYGQLLQSLKRAGWAILVQTNLIPLFTLACLAVIALTGVVPLSVELITVATVGAAAMAALAGWFLWRRFAGEIRAARPVFPSNELFAVSVPLFWVASMNLVIGWTDTIMVGMFADSGSVGIYSMASRMAMLGSIVLIAANTISAPKFAALHAKGDMANLQRIAQFSARGTTIATLPLLAVFMIAPASIMSIYGPEFAAGGTALAVLSVAQLVNLMSGSVVFLLMMTGRQKTVSRAMTVAAVGNAALNFVLIPAYGYLGACIATTISISVINLALVWTVWRELGIVSAVFPSHRVRSGETA